MSLKNLKFLLITIASILYFFNLCFSESPQDLEKWKNFILYQNDTYYCPPLFNDCSKNFCTWPGILDIKIKKNKLIFTQKIRLFKKGAVELPGNINFFPENIFANDKKMPAALMEHTPLIFPGKGDFNIKGEIKYSKIPDYINIPKNTGGIKIKIENKNIEMPYLDQEGRLWFKNYSIQGMEKEKKHTRVEVFRKVKDSIPCEITTLFRIHSSGITRQEKLFTGNIPGKIAGFKSDLPLKIHNNKYMTVQVKAGSWNVEIKNILPSPPDEIGPFNSPYGKEIIVHQNSPGIRITRWKNLKSIDPTMTDLPVGWKKYPAYIISKNEKIIIEEIIRGTGPEKSDLSLEREIWIDFDGKGASIEDKIKGRSNHRTFIGINNNKNFVPGKMKLNGKNQVIALKKNCTGLPVDSGNINITSLMRKISKNNFFPTGWNQNFSNIKGAINIPPARTLFSVSGADLKGNYTFISKWTLLDLFVLCILALSAFKIWNYKWGIIFFIAAGFIYHKFYLPPYFWLILIAGSAAVSFFKKNPDLKIHNVFKTSVFIIYGLIFISILSTGIVFSYKNIRNSFFPQLQKFYSRPSINYRNYEQEDFLEAKHMPLEKQKISSSIIKKTRQFPVYKAPVQSLGYTQTGQGKPNWRWQRILFESASLQGITIRILPPFMTRIIFLLNVLCLWLMIFKFFPLKNFGSKKFSFKNIIPVLLLCFLFQASINQGTAHAAYPSDKMLENYKQRLLSEKEFFYDAAFIKKCIIKAEKNNDAGINSKIKLIINSVRDCAVSIPDFENTCKIEEILLDGKKQGFALKQGQKVFTFIPTGIHEITIFVKSKKDRINIKFDPLPAKLSVQTDGIETNGVDKGFFLQNISLYIPGSDKNIKKMKNSVNLTPFPVITREISLGLEWKIKTSIRRYYSQNIKKRINTEIQLLKNEKILTPGIEVNNNKLTISLDPGKKIFFFESEIPIMEKIKIYFPENSFQKQIWSVESTPLWDYDIRGGKIYKIENLNKTAFIIQPGGTPVINITKLNPYKGRFLNLESATLVYDLKKTRNSLSIKAEINAGKSLSHKISYEPDVFSCQSLKINGLKNPVIENNGKITIPVSYGRNTVELFFIEKKEQKRSFLPKIISFPKIDLGIQSSNISQEITYSNRLFWLIACFGPQLGPAVLFWGYFATIIIFGLILSKIPGSPLKAREWVLLFAGLSIVSPPEIIMVCAFFFILEFKKNKNWDNSKYFNLIQTAIILLLLLSAKTIYNAVSQGLLGIPDMQIKGSGSWAGSLIWYTDRSDSLLPRPFIIKSGLIVWKTIMFAWAIWIAYFIINKAQYFLTSFKNGGLWKKSKKIKHKNKFWKNEEIKK